MLTTFETTHHKIFKYEIHYTGWPFAVNCKREFQAAD